MSQHDDMPSLQTQVEGGVFHIRKMSYVIPISEEMLPGYVDPRPGHPELPAAEDVDAFEVWKAKFEPLYKEGRKHGWFTDGGPDYGFEYTPPEDGWVYDDDEEAAK